MALFIVSVRDPDGECYEYEYGSLSHARAHCDAEPTECLCTIYEYKNGEHYFVETR